MDRIEKTDKNVTGAIDGGMAAGCVLERGEKRKTGGENIAVEGKRPGRRTGRQQ
ncbi:hypothetical protein [Caproiciproducens sp. CPB-2]|uniref:hypothetical protein n=1 Tax=Caproiciproducens sp. CPB-2 TaxID=3030017 RepID=UPI0023DA49C1|nr:hypothetical protein [Caproiciproducens sp. CPB-2]MDF1495402.1 hypothetical protein [Caproiciproducens sp. CPB-2]